MPARVRPCSWACWGWRSTCPATMCSSTASWACPSWGRGLRRATALCYWFMGLTLALYARREARCRKLGPLFLPLLLPRTAGEGGEARRVDWPLVWRIFRIGLPGALAACFEASLFAVTAPAAGAAGQGGGGRAPDRHELFQHRLHAAPVAEHHRGHPGGAEPGGRASGTGPPFGPHGPCAWGWAWPC